MKVGTDSVLLGAWSDLRNGNVLDIGCGTGLIALMLAQRNPKSIIDAIDIEEQAIVQTVENVNASGWKNTINVIHTATQEFNPNYQYNLIITNPPYFANSTKAPSKSRTTARHNNTLSFQDLIETIHRLLKPEGIFTLILPVEESQLFIKEAEKNNLFLNRKCLVKPNPDKNPKRILMEFAFQKTALKEEELTIETDKRHQYTKDYITLTQDFYLNF